MLFHVLARSHHHVRDFVRDDYDEGELFRNGVDFFLGNRSDLVQNVLAIHVVVGSHMPDTNFRKQLVTFVHFFNRPRKHGFGFTHVRDDRVHQVRQRSVAAQFDHLRVDHQHADFVWTSSHQDRADDRVQTNGLTGTSSTSDQKVRQRGQVGNHRSTHGIGAQEQRDFHFGNLLFRLLNHLTQANNLSSLIGDFDADTVLARDRCDDTHARHPHRNGQVIRQRGDFLQTQAGGEVNFVLRNYRASFDFDDFDIVAKLLASQLKDLRFLESFPFLLLKGNFLRVLE